MNYIFSLILLSCFFSFRISFRKIGQLWYELFSFSANLSPSEIQERLQYSTNKKLILAMHPHGIIPIQAFLWAAYADQYFDGVVNGERISLYGFGAAADAVAYIPFLRNIMGFLTAGSASYKPLFNGITKVIRQFSSLFHFLFFLFYYYSNISSIIRVKFQ